MVSNEILQAIDDYGTAEYCDGSQEGAANGPEFDRSEESVEERRAALIALLARDAALIARLENVAKMANALCDEADPDVIDGAWVVSDAHYWALKSALNADAPGGG